MAGHLNSGDSQAQEDSEGPACQNQPGRGGSESAWSVGLVWTGGWGVLGTSVAPDESLCSHSKAGWPLDLGES